MKTILILLLCASPVFAQSDPEPQPMRRDFARWVLIATMASDHVSTGLGLSKGYQELNPTFKWANNEPAKIIPTMVAMDVAGTYAWTRLMKAKHPTIYKVGLYAAASWRGYLAVKNTRLYLKARAEDRH